MQHHRFVTRAAIVAMRSIAENGGLVFDPKHVRSLREVQQRFPKLVTIAPAPEGAAPRPFFVAALTDAGRKVIRRRTDEVRS